MSLQLGHILRPGRKVGRHLNSNLVQDSIAMINDLLEILECLGKSAVSSQDTTLLDWSENSEM